MEYYDTIPALVAALGVLLFTLLMLRRIQYVGANESLLVTKLTEKVVISGPRVYFPNPLTVVSTEKRAAVPLTELQYMKVKDDTTGIVRVVRGPCSVVLGAHECSVVGPQAAVRVSKTESVTINDASNGAQRTLRGPAVFVPGPFEEVAGKQSGIVLKQGQYIRIQDTLTGLVRIEKGEAVIFLEPHERKMCVPTAAYSLKAHTFVRLRDVLSGTVRVERGEKLVFPCAHEEPLDDPPVQDAIDLKSWEYVYVQDRTTGAVRVERGEKLVWLSGSERVLHGGKQEAVLVDTEHAVLVRERSSGEQRLVQEPGLFVPAANEEVVEVRSLIRLAQHEAIVLKDEKGAYSIRFGDENKGTERAFFLPPYWETVTLRWSRGRRREKRDLRITIFDTRPQYMSFEFNSRTSDNVEMVLEGTFFWEIVDIAAMLQFTGDAPGDVCAHARSCFIQLISKVTLQEFMDSFNQIAKAAHSGDDEFYSKRGIKIHTLEVTRYACADRSTATILEEIIQETTNRMNRLSCQESENEVQLAKIQGQVEQEKAKSAVLAIQQQHAVEQARSAGLAEAERCVAFLKRVQGSDDGSDGDGSHIVGSPKLAEELWHALRKSEALHELAGGSAHLYFTPQDANISIVNRAAAD